jgi:hypothetical protein
MSFFSPVSSLFLSLLFNNEGQVKLRAIFWILAMAYTGFLLASQGALSFNSLTISEGLLGGVTGFLLSIMFTLRAIRRQRGRQQHS